VTGSDTESNGLERQRGGDLKVIILAGGVGSRLSEETGVKPKPMVEVGGRPLLWHIMKSYGACGYTEFIVALGYMGRVIKRYFADCAVVEPDLTITLHDGKVIRHVHEPQDPWTVRLIDTGQETHTGGRIRRLSPHIDGTFMATYGDGVADLDINDLVRFHQSHGRLATLTAVRPPARFGAVELDGDLVSSFREKPQTGEGWINGGFFVLEPEVLDYIEDDRTDFSKEPLQKLAADNQLAAYQHDSFWQCMDTLRDKELLQSLWDSGQAPWKIW
jgi:glucose-1-phosphate cytidylyltransferase